MTLAYVYPLSDEGIEKFRQLLREAREENGKTPLSQWLDEAREILEDSECIIRNVSRRVDLDDEKTFPTQYDFATYLRMKLPKELQRNPWAKEAKGLWEAIAIFYAHNFDCSKKPLFATEEVRWILETRNWHLHYAFSGFCLLCTIGEENSRYLLSSRLGVFPDAYLELCKRQWVISCPSLVRLAIRLYWDAENNRWKPLIGRDNPGGVRRLCEVLAQFDYTYDLHSLEPETLLAMLPSEFDPFKGLSYSSR
ncbi:MAG: hypothetical protein ACPL7D_10510 [Candidatus Sumerlaeaceae bacterium]